MVCLNGVTASAAENPGGWIELLEYSSVQTNGENWFTINGKTGGFTLPLYGEKRLCKVDMLIWHQYAERITAATVTAGNSTNNLTILHVGEGLSRVFGAIPNSYYEFLNVTISHSTASQVTFELLSCKVTPVQTTDMLAHGTIWVDDNSSDTISAPGSFLTEGDGTDLTLPWQTPILINDWQKFDSVSVYGSLSGIGLNSVRCSIGAKGLPYQITYTSTNPTGTGVTYRESVSISHYDTSDTYYGNITGTHDTNTAYLGKVLFTITVDLAGIDRTVTQPLVVYFTGVTYDLHAHAFNCQNLSGSIITPDTSGLSWWTRFTVFMEGLFASDANDTNDMMQSAADRGQELAEDRLGAVAQAGDVLDGLVGAFDNHGITESVLFPSLTVTFSGVPFTFGGWEVPVIPDGFEPLVETLKLIVDIVATLLFIQAMRKRLESLLAGGNA